MENTPAQSIAASTPVDNSVEALAAQMDREARGETDPIPEAVEAERVAAKYAEIARRNQALRARQREIKAPLVEKDAELEKMRAEVARLKQFEEISDPMELLKARGMSYEDIINKNLDPEAFDTKAELQKLRAEIEEYKQSAAEEKKTHLEKQKESVVEDYVNHITKFTQGQPEKYELINTLGHHRDVYETIVEMHKKTGKVISDEEAADLVEKFLEAQMEKQLDQFTKINKLKNKITPITDEIQQSDPYSQSPTLSNQLTTQTTASKTKLSEEETLRRAASFLKWTT